MSSTRCPRARPKRDSDLTPSERQAKLRMDARRPVCAGDIEREWKRLARAILEQALADGEYYVRAGERVDNLRRQHERSSHILHALEPCRAELLLFYGSDWCALLCDVAGLGYERYVSSALGIIGGAA